MMRGKKTIRCAWALGGGALYQRYHDKEWGNPVKRDRKHFEFIVLEGAQAGLSWATILKRREGYRRAFAGFDPQKVARFSPQKVQVLLRDESIIRNRLKIESAINNARRFLAISEAFGSFNRYIWQFVNGKPIVNLWKSGKEVPATTALSDEISRDLKKRGFKFVGSTIVYAYMQAVGLVNDHEVNCFISKEKKL